MHKASHYKMPAGIVMSWLSLARFYGRAIGIPARYKTSLIATPVWFIYYSLVTSSLSAERTNNDE